ncbi:PQ loop repeat protein [Delphinella strobiligena]|nr:PQ loop repeat protein [Delphinella strobiligena]
MDVSVAANVLGTIGAVCWSIQLIPQIIINYRRHNATGLQPTMMMFWAWAGVPLGVYNIVSGFNIALQVQPQILAFLSLTTWIQVYYYEKKWSVFHILAIVVPIAAVMAGIELGLIFALRSGKSRGATWPITLMAVLAALFLALGVLRHYLDIYLHRTVRGISFIFCGIDALGDLTSILALLFQPKIEILGMIIYAVELALWIGIFVCGGYYNLTPWLKQRMASRASTPAVSTGPTPESGNGNDQDVMAGSVALHDLPSSTSVFRTSSASVDAARSRVGRSSLQPIRNRVL